MDTQTPLTVKQEPVISTCICSHCKQELPAEAFYYNRHKQCYDRYCKECRKQSSRKQRNSGMDLQNVNANRRYPVITSIRDAKLRMFLITQALQKVRESVQQKLRKQHEQEFKDFE